MKSPQEQFLTHHQLSKKGYSQIGCDCVSPLFHEHVKWLHKLKCTAASLTYTLRRKFCNIKFFSHRNAMWNAPSYARYHTGT